MSQVRIQKLIAASGIKSRRNAEKLIREGRVRVNGHKAYIGQKANPEEDIIDIDGQLIALKKEYKVILINKPRNVICTCNDPQGRQTVIELLPIDLRYGLFPIGRLDFKSRGALLLTNHGELALKLSHPRYFHSKTYQILVRGTPSQETINKWRGGIILDGKKTLKAKVNLLRSKDNKSLIQIILREGRNRQIRRIADMLGHPVIDLKRTAINNIRINNIREGEWKLLKRQDWQFLLRERKA